MKSSFIDPKRLSKEDTIIQFYRPKIAARVLVALDVFERLVTEAETVTVLGVTLTPGNSQPYQCTPADLKGCLDEFQELEQIATLGRDLLKTLGYVSQRRLNPIAGTAPVGTNVEVQPVTVRLPGQEPVEGAIVTPKK